MISTYQNKLRVVLKEQYEKVRKVLTGIFIKRPPQPSAVVNFMMGMEDNEKLAVKLFSLKLAVLIIILPSERPSEILYSHVTFITFKPNSVVLHFRRVTKCWKKVKKLPILNYLNFQKINFALLNALRPTFLSQKVGKELTKHNFYYLKGRNFCDHKLLWNLFLRLRHEKKCILGNSFLRFRHLMEKNEEFIFANPMF